MSWLLALPNKSPGTSQKTAFVESGWLPLQVTAAFSIAARGYVAPYFRPGRINLLAPEKIERELKANHANLSSSVVSTPFRAPCQNVSASFPNREFGVDLLAT